MRTTISPEPALLGFLRAGPVHGYDLYKRVTKELAPVWHLGLSQMYAILNEYAARGWIQARIEAQGLRPSKKVLELTPAGRKAFDTWMAQPARGLREFRVDFFARLYFARALGNTKTGDLVGRQIAECKRELNKLKAGRSAQEGPEDEFRHAVRQFRVEQLRAALNWLENNRGRLSPSRRTRPGRLRSRRPTLEK